MSRGPLLNHGWIEADAVVAHTQLEALRLTPQLDGNILRTGVPDDIGNRFLDHPETSRLHGRIDLQAIDVGDEGRAQLCALRLLVHQPAQRRHESQFVE